MVFLDDRMIVAYLLFFCLETKEPKIQDSFYIPWKRAHFLIMRLPIRFTREGSSASSCENDGFATEFKRCRDAFFHNYSKFERFDFTSYAWN